MTKKTKIIIMFPKQPGVYCFKNTVNNKVYIGSAQCLNTRINRHFKNRGSNRHLQNAIQYYGINTFCITYQVLETKEEALCLEQMLLDYIFKLNINCYNISKIAVGTLLSDYSGHNKHLAKVRFALEVNSPTSIHTFKSSYEAAKFTEVHFSNVSHSCKAAKPYNSESGRWLFSDVSIDDLKTKFNSVYKPLKQGYKVNQGNLSMCLMGKLKTVNGYRVSLVI